MADEQMEYFKSEEYVDDLLNHKIHIYDIPFQGRTKSVYIAAYRANCAVWDGSDKANEYRMEMELLVLTFGNILFGTLIHSTFSLIMSFLTLGKHLLLLPSSYLS